MTYSVGTCLAIYGPEDESFEWSKFNKFVLTKGVSKMKTKMTLIAVLIIGFVGMGFMAFATEQKADKDAAVKTTQEVPAALIQVRGVMERSETGLALFDGNDTYELKGCENIKDVKVEDMIGKLVKISGDLEKNDKGAFINVKEVAVAN